MHRIDLQRAVEYAFPEKPLGEYSAKELTVATLGYLAIGTLLVSAIAVPGLSHAFKLFGVKTRNERWRLYQRLKRLEADGLIVRSGKYYVPSAKGQRLLTRALLAQQKRKPKRWDGRWHLVMFDLPAKHLRARTDLRNFLKELGFFHYQHSIYLHKFDMRATVEQFCELYGIREHVNFAIVLAYDNEQWVRSILK
mgnify:CR=1 FL=1